MFNLKLYINDIKNCVNFHIYIYMTYRYLYVYIKTAYMAHRWTLNLVKWQNDMLFLQTLLLIGGEVYTCNASFLYIFWLSGSYNTDFPSTSYTKHKQSIDLEWSNINPLTTVKSVVLLKTNTMSIGPWDIRAYTNNAHNLHNDTTCTHSWLSFYSQHYYKITIQQRRWQYESIMWSLNVVFDSSL